ncbi:MAG: hypothetical protein ACE5Z5_14710 [Candidatus Bathyarchaeia archaeon]
MSFIRCKKRGDRKYYYEVENRWVRGKVKQRVIRYIGTSPLGQRRETNEFEAHLIAEAILKRQPSREEVLEILKSLGVSIPQEFEGEVKRVGLQYDLVKKTTYLAVE